MSAELEARVTLQLRRIVANREAALRGRDGRPPSPLLRRAVDRRTATLLTNLRAMTPSGSPLLDEIDAAREALRDPVAA